MNSDELAEALHEAEQHYSGIDHIGVEMSEHTGLNFVVRGRTIPNSVRDLENEDNIHVPDVRSEHGQVEFKIRTGDAPGE